MCEARMTVSVWYTSHDRPRTHSRRRINHGAGGYLVDTLVEELMRDSFYQHAWDLAYRVVIPTAFWLCAIVSVTVWVCR